MRPGSEAEFMEIRGYLTINQLVKYLAECHPTMAVSYPTLKRYFEKGHFKYTKVGGQHRIARESIERYCQFGTATDEEVERAKALSTSQAEDEEAKRQGSTPESLVKVIDN